MYIYLSICHSTGSLWGSQASFELIFLLASSTYLVCSLPLPTVCLPQGQCQKKSCWEGGPGSRASASLSFLERAGLCYFGEFGSFCWSWKCRCQCSQCFLPLEECSHKRTKKTRTGMFKNIAMLDGKWSSPQIILLSPCLLLSLCASAPVAEFPPGSEVVMC